MTSARILNCEVTSRRCRSGARELQNRIPKARKRRDYPSKLGKVRASCRGFASRREFQRIFQIIRSQPADILPANEKREKSGLWAAEILPAKLNCCVSGARLASRRQAKRPAQHDAQHHAEQVAEHTGNEREGKERKRKGRRAARSPGNFHLCAASTPASKLHLQGGHAPRSPCVRLNRFLPGYGIQS